MTAPICIWCRKPVNPAKHMTNCPQRPGHQEARRSLLHDLVRQEPQPNLLRDLITKGERER